MLTMRQACLGKEGSSEREQEDLTPTPTPPTLSPQPHVDEHFIGEMHCIGGILRLMAWGFVKIRIRNCFLIRNMLTKCLEEGLSWGEVARCFGLARGFCSAALLRQWDSSS